jgi:hypothetical protein
VRFVILGQSPAFSRELSNIFRRHRHAALKLDFSRRFETRGSCFAIARDGVVGMAPLPYRNSPIWRLRTVICGASSAWEDVPRPRPLLFFVAGLDEAANVGWMYAYGLSGPS